MSTIKPVNQLMQQIIAYTSNMESNYPELYKYLDETPLLLSNKQCNGIYISDFEKYFETLKDQVLNYREIHEETGGKIDLK